MKHLIPTSALKKITALLLALMLALPAGSGAFALGNTPMIINLQWTGPDGVPQSAGATQVFYPGFEDCYWAFLPSDAPLDALTVHLSDPTNTYPSFSIPSGTLLPYVADAGMSLNSVNPVEIMAFTADGQPGMLFYLYVSTLAPLPEDPAAQTQAGMITIRYETADGMQVASPETREYPLGSHEIFAQPYDLQPGYQLSGPGSQWVTVEEGGAQVVFLYEKPVQPATITVRYQTLEGAQVASPHEVTVNPGANEVFPAPYDLQPGYQLAQGYPSYHVVTVDAYGPSMAEIVFYYQPATAMITVSLVDQATNQVLSTYQAEVKLNQVNTLSLDAGMIPADYAPAGAPVLDLYVNDLGQTDVQPVFYLYSTLPTPAPVFPAQVQVLYLDADSRFPVASNTQTECPVGQVTPIFPAPFDLLPDYQLISDGMAYVTVDAFGQPDQQEVVFLYRYTPPATEVPTPAPTEVPTPEPTLVPTPEPTPVPTAEPTLIPTEMPTPAPTDLPVIPPISLNVVYLDMLSGLNVATATQVQCEAGKVTAVEPRPFDLLPGYYLVSDPIIEVSVDAYGIPTMPEVAFLYQYIPQETQAPTPEPTQEPTPAPTAPPAPKIALVGVKYLDPTGNTFYNYTETCAEGAGNLIQVNWNLVPAGYELASPESVSVTVDAYGAAQPAEVIFQFQDELNAYVTIFFRTLSGQSVASPVQELCLVGNNSFEARPLDLQPNYQLIGPNVQNVVLDSNGTLSPHELVFLYEYLPTPSPVPQAPTPLPYDYIPMDSYCYPQNDGINFRSSPTTEENNIIATVMQSNLAHILGRMVNSKNEVWYLVDIGGRQGFLKETVVRVLTDAEIAALFNYTPAPTVVPTPVPTEIPDGAPIDLWATTNNSVNFRKTPEITNSNKIRSLSKNTRLWVYSSQTVDGEKWYSVLVNGTSGYLMAQYVNLASQSESALIQSQLPSPMPTQIPLPTVPPTLPPTAVPTATPVPTASPVPTPSASPVPENYRGYALTLWQTPLRTGVSNTDDSVLEMLRADSLVYVTVQTYVDGVAWSSVQSIASGNLGFIPHEALRLISAEEARPYLENLQPVQPATATPVPQQTQGYAMTLGEGVPLRSFPDTNGEIIQFLPYGAVANVQGQSYASGTTWHMVQFGGVWGFIRQDQMRMLSPEESIAYEESLKGATPSPSPAPTPEPVTQDSPSSYGHVLSNSGKVNLRSAPKLNSTRIRLLDNYAFALVMGTEVNEEGTWYHVSQNGTEGYIHGDYFKVLSLGELTTFLQSPEYLNGNQSSSTGSNSTQIHPVEDHNQVLWQNPALNASYEPFNPYLTPTPDPERLPTATPVPTQTPTPAPTAHLAPVGPQGGWTTPAPTTKTSSSAWLWLLLFIAVIGIGGAAYAYSIHRKNEQRRQAVRAQQARQARAAAAQQPQMRAAQNNPQATRSYRPQNAAPFMPPQNSTPRPPQAPAAPAQNAGKLDQDTNPYRPVNRRPTVYEAPRQETQAFRPQQAPAAQETVKYTAAPQETRAYQPAQNAAPRQETQAYQALRTPAESYQRRRRTDRHRDQDLSGEE